MLMWKNSLRNHRDRFKMEAIPTYGDHMSYDKWILCVKAGGFVDYDGHGYLATETEMSNVQIWPSLIKKANFNSLGFTHVVWFNR